MNSIKRFLIDLKLLVLVACIVGCSNCIADGSVPPQTIVKELFTFLVQETYETRLGTQPLLMAKWLTTELFTYSNIIECDAERAKKEEERPLIYVDAEIFFDRWDTPKQCTVSELRPDGDKQVARVGCRWGKGQDHSEGEEMQLFVELVSESGTWKISNVKHGKQETAGSTKTDLITRMRVALKQSSHPEYCASKFKKIK